MRNTSCNRSWIYQIRFKNNRKLFKLLKRLANLLFVYVDKMIPKINTKKWNNLNRDQTVSVEYFDFKLFLNLKLSFQKFQILVEKILKIRKITNFNFSNQISIPCIYFNCSVKSSSVWCCMSLFLYSLNPKKQPRMITRNRIIQMNK